MTIRQVRAGLVTVILVAVAVRILWWSIEPLIPYVVAGLALVTVIGFVIHRKTRW